MKKLTAKFTNQNGVAMPMVLMTLLFLTLLGHIALTTASVEVRLAANERDYQQAVYTAEAGIAHTRAVLKGLLNVCNQTNIASGSPVTWDFVLQDIADCPALAGQSRPLSIKANLGSYQYNVATLNNSDDPSNDSTMDEDQKIVVTSIATGPNNVRAGIEVVLDAENSASDVSGGNPFQLGGGAGKSFVGRDANAITDLTTTDLGNL